MNDEQKPQVDGTKAIMSSYLTTQQRLELCEKLLHTMADHLNRVTDIVMQMIVQQDLLMKRAGVTAEEVKAHKETLDANRAANS